jgi:hypothetical protein
MTMDSQTLIAIAALFIANIGTTIGLFTWATSHAATATQNHREETRRILEAIQAEMKDFHGRLCKIEESRNR